LPIRGGLIAALLLLPVAAAWAEGDSVTERTRKSSSQTVLGQPDANACAKAAGEGRADAESIAHCSQALKTERLSRQNQGIVHINRAAMLMRQGDGASALADLDEAAKRLPDNADIQLNRGVALIMTGQPAKAVSALTQSLQMNVRNPHMAYYHRAAARERLNDLRGALEDYTAALDINPDWALAEAELARFVRVRRDQVAQALADDAAPGSQP
jgi:tetratricopeptide (TPR) repeat protein